MGTFRHRQQQAGLIYDLLPPERALGSGLSRRFGPKPDVVDAEFVTVIPSRIRTASGSNARDGAFRPSQSPRPAPKGAFLHALTGLRLAEGWLQQASRRSFVALIVALAILVFGLAGGFSGLSGTPAQATSEPLQFSHVTLTPRDENGMRVLTVNGIIENETGATLSVPPVRADIFSGGQLLTSVVVNPPVNRIGPHESRGFSTRLQHPGGKMPDVRLSFMP
ncbi:hypothetical protein ACXHXG_19240 [Rhizobium sp. LEGMi198b]|uniref:hypothetical protein n=1 Tax=unclassified Rhizobium TaxID=2613769 RepID=UPI000CDF4471|nr:MULTISPECIES: hypothetical protein [Rhizobium]AVA23181.1 hypothetical protein NXC24_CH03567 [Rhizobium sp. NXC24]MDK4739826.1 hypothetical protein [Rhizobium sp. CNPSo 3464]UWU20543.1 hypothetical protein N2601_14835 [Rhizobium tropici]